MTDEILEAVGVLMKAFRCANLQSMKVTIGVIENDPKGKAGSAIVATDKDGNKEYHAVLPTDCIWPEN